MKTAPFTRPLAALTLLVCLSGCGLLNFSSLILDGNFSTATDDPVTASGNEDDLEAFSESEAELFGEGPIEVPVGMAKLESPDPALVNVTVTETGGVVESGSSYLRYAIAAGSNVRFDFEFQAGALPDPGDTTPKAFLYNVQTGRQTVILANADGSGTGRIVGVQGDRILLASMNDRETAISPFYVYDVDLDGIVSVTETNARNLASFTRLITDNKNNSYFTTIKDTMPATYNFWRRNRDGSLAELIAANLTREPRYIDVVDGNRISVLFEDGMISVFVLNSVLPADSLSPQLAVTSENVDGSLFTEFALGSNGDGPLGPADAPQGRRLIMLNSQQGVLSVVPPMALDGHQNPYLVRFIPLQTTGGPNEVVDLVNTQEFDRAVVAKGGNNKIFIFARPVGKTHFTLFQIELRGPSDAATAWADRVTIIPSFSGFITYMSAANNNTLVFSVQDGVGNINYWYWDGSQATMMVNLKEEGLNYSERFFLTRDGDSLVTCDLGEEDETHQLVRHRIGVYPQGVFVFLTDYLESSSCSAQGDSYSVDSMGILHFLRYDQKTDTFQKAHLDLEKFDAFAEAQGEALFD